MLELHLYVTERDLIRLRAGQKATGHVKGPYCPEHAIFHISVPETWIKHIVTTTPGAVLLEPPLR